MSTIDASVVIPVCNGAATIGEQLDALARQTYAGRWEVVVSDNGSTDATAAVVASYTDRLPGLVVVDASDARGAAHARNVGAGAASGEVLAFCDADDIVAVDWLERLVAATATAPIVAGRIDSVTLNDERSRRWRPPVPDREPPVSHGFLPYAFGANLAVRRDAFTDLGGFREDYPLGEDVELTWRGQLAGLGFGFARDATVHYRYRPGLVGLLRQYVGYGAIGPRLYRDFRAAGMPPSRPRGAVGPWIRLLLALPVAVWHEERRGDVLRRLAFRYGRLLGSLRAKVVYL